jgi:hypothetical protein
LKKTLNVPEEAMMAKPIISESVPVKNEAE